MGSGLVFSPQEIGYKPAFEQSHASTQLIATIQDASEEFRETSKVNSASEASSERSNFIKETILHSFNIVSVAQYNSYVEKQLLQRPSSRLYLDQRSLII